VSLLDGRRSVLFVHAHPDDETITTGALIAELVARGTRVSLLTLTRGERGEVVPGVVVPGVAVPGVAVPGVAVPGVAVPGAAGDPQGTDALTREREAELRRAIVALGIAAHFWLGALPARAPGLAPRRYRDSGMRWLRPGVAGPALDNGVDGMDGVNSANGVDGIGDSAALTAAPLDDVTADIRALLETLRPDLVVSYDDEGGYGHPDHVRAHHAALAACRAGGVPFAEIVRAPGADVEWFDLEARRGTVTAALRCHATQLTVELTGDGGFIVHSGGQREAITTSIGLRAR
jgi:N-acetyl-1-D-myo-inositol-2-amino-2-deoxy-alpha-D-glucopyranoside deacetylase